MKIVVCIKAVPGYITDPKIAEKKDSIDYKAGSIVINESDDYALEEAIALKKKAGGEVIVLTVGSLSSQKALQTALAKGADMAVRVDAYTMDSKTTAILLAHAVRQLGYDLIVTGVEASDTMAAQVGLRIAGMLDIPFAYAVTEAEIGERENTVQTVKEIGYGLTQKEMIRLPALLCVQTGSTPTSFVPFKKMMMAQKKPIKTFKPADLGLGKGSDIEPELKILDMFSPADTAQAEMITGSSAEMASIIMSKIREVA